MLEPKFALSVNIELMSKQHPQILPPLEKTIQSNGCYKFLKLIKMPSTRLVCGSGLNEVVRGVLREIWIEAPRAWKPQRFPGECQYDVGGGASWNCHLRVIWRPWKAEKTGHFKKIESWNVK